MRETSEFVAVESSILSSWLMDFLSGKIGMMELSIGIVGFDQDAGKRFCTHDVQVINLEEVECY